MNPTAAELWNDPLFILKRIGEQVDYLKGLEKTNALTIGYLRWFEKWFCALEVWRNLRMRFFELTGIDI
jgi:hypothetical protein